MFYNSGLVGQTTLKRSVATRQCMYALTNRKYKKHNLTNGVCMSHPVSLSLTLKQISWLILLEATRNVNYLLRAALANHKESALRRRALIHVVHFANCDRRTFSNRSWTSYFKRSKVPTRGVFCDLPQTLIAKRITI